MMPGMNSRQAKQMMKKMGIAQTDLDAVQVIIRLKDKNLVINDPEVSKISMQGQDTFQVAGAIVEEEGATFEVTDEDIETVMGQTQCSREEAKEALEKTEGDIAEAILHLS